MATEPADIPQQLKAALDTLAYLTQLVEDKNMTIARLRQILFGASSEKMSQVLQTLTNHNASSGEPDRTLESAEGEVGRKTDRSLPRNVQARGAPCSPELWAVR